tara:strand:- start:267 stop:974 length:708 start_codon:yes stop_codon:yes gene_type:complete
MSTPAKVGEWLRNNKGNLPDAYKAVGYEGEPLKIKEGNLTNNREKIRVAKRGANGDLSRRAAENLNPPQNKQEQNQNRRQNYKRSSLRKAGKNVVIDHHHELKLLGQTVDGMTPQQAKAEIKRLEKSYGPLGNRPGNRKIVGARFNELKRQGSKQLQQHLGRLAAKPVVGRPMFGSVAGVLLGFLPEIDEITGGHINNGINSAMNGVKDQVQKSAEFYTNLWADRQDKGYDLHVF